MIMKNKKRTLVFLLVALVMVLVSGVFSSALQTNFGRVDVVDIRMDMGAGEQFSVIMFKPKTATPATPAPVIIASHGYLNNREMQDIALVELARRGFVVISMDRTGHGHSEVSAAAQAGMIQLVEYAYKLDFIDNTKIAVTGHSLGAGSATGTTTYYAGLERTAMLAVATYAFNEGLIPTAIPTSTATQAIYDQLKVISNEALQTKLAEAKALNKIFAALPVANNPSTVANNIGVDVRFGLIAGNYDEFFFKQAGKYTHYNANLTTPDISPNVTNMAMYEWNPRDYLSSPNAASLIKTVYAGFATTTRKTVPTLGQDGYDAALLDPTRTNPDIAVPTTPVVMGQYYTATGPKDFSHTNIVAERAVVIYMPDEIHPWNHFSTETAQYTIEFFNNIFGVMPGYKYLAPTNQTWLAKELFNFVGLVGFFLAILPVTQLLLAMPFFAKAKKEPTEDLPAMKKWYQYVLFFGIGLAVSLACGFLIRYFTSANFFGTNFFKVDQFYPQPTTNPVAVWAAGCGLLAFAVFLIQYFVYAKKNGSTVAHWGVKLECGNIVKMLALAFSAVFLTYGLLWFVDFFFKTDFRLWSFAIRTFESIRIATAIRYMSVFIIYYFLSSLIINGGNRMKGMPEWVNIAISATFQVLGIAIIFAIQYGTFFRTGALWHWDMNLTYIVLFPIIPILVIAAIYSRKLYRATGSIWLAAFLNTALFTLITVANTATNFNYILFR
jgi:pimeloyl-ACP methyl ester carboxylesterase